MSASCEALKDYPLQFCIRVLEARRWDGGGPSEPGRGTRLYTRHLQICIESVHQLKCATAQCESITQNIKLTGTVKMRLDELLSPISGGYMHVTTLKRKRTHEDEA